MGKSNPAPVGISDPKRLGQVALQGVELAAQAQYFDQGAVPFHIFVLQVCQQLTTLTDHLEQTATGMVVFLVLPQVGRQVVDVLSQDSNLDFRGTRVHSVRLMLFDQLLFALLS
jgi:hypothetical protein